MMEQFFFGPATRFELLVFTFGLILAIRAVEKLAVRNIIEHIDEGGEAEPPKAVATVVYEGRPFSVSADDQLAALFAERESLLLELGKQTTQNEIDTLRKLTEQPENANEKAA